MENNKESDRISEIDKAFRALAKAFNNCPYYERGIIGDDVEQLLARDESFVENIANLFDTFMEKVPVLQVTMTQRKIGETANRTGEVDTIMYLSGIERSII